VAGAFQIKGGGPLTAGGAPLDARDVAARAGKPDGFDVRVDGRSIFDLDYAHAVGRREPLRPQPADLSDLARAAACPPDHVLIDPRTGRLRFFAGDDPAHFQSKVTARIRGTHGDNAQAFWRGDVLFLSHWESAYNLWAYDVSDPSAPARVGELTVANFAHGFVLLDAGLALMGTTEKGLFLLDLRDPRKMQVVKPLSLKADWLAPITSRYVAAWPGNDWKNPRVFDASRLPDDFPEATDDVAPAVLRCLAGRKGPVLAGGSAWFFAADEGGDRLALLDLSGAPTAWRVVREIKLPEVQTMKGSRAEIQIAAAAPGKRFVLFYPNPDGKKVLQVLDVEGEREKFWPPVPVEESASQVSVPNEKFAYLCVQPKDRGAGVVGTYDGTRMSIYDISDPEQIKQAGSWDPGYPTRDMELVPRPGKGDVVLVKEPGGGGGIQFADFSDPRKPKVLAEVPTNGEGNRVAAWGDQAMYTSSTLAQWFDVSDPLAPKRLGTWSNHRWFWVRSVHGDLAVMSISEERTTDILDFKDPTKPVVAAKDAPADAAWGTRLYGLHGGPRSGQGPIHLRVAEMTDAGRLTILSDVEYPKDDLDVPGIAGSWADGPWLYAVTEGKKGDAVFLVWDVSDGRKPALVGRLHDPELEVRRGEGFWTAQGRVLTAARGVAVITAYGRGAPQVIDVHNPSEPKFLLRLPYQGKQAHHVNEMTDCYPDGPWFYIKSYPDPLQLWDFHRPEEPRVLWEEPTEFPYDTYGWEAGVPVGGALLAPKLAHLKVMTAPRPSQVPAGKVTWRFRP
jgi:hypothetical protein